MFVLFVAVITGVLMAYTKKMFAPRSIWPIIIFTIAAIAVLAMAFRRDTYLPFLGPTAAPISMIEATRPANCDASVEVDAKGGSRVLYWAADETTSNPRESYGDFSNAGVAEVSTDGKATLHFRCPGTYEVGRLMKRRLPRHVHWRVAYPNGMMSRVKTRDVTCTPAPKSTKSLMTNILAAVGAEVLG
jgi:hypothetical protein